MSTNLKPKYLRSNFLSITESLVDNDQLLDLFDPKYNAIFDKLVAYTPYKYTAPEHITNISQKFYGTTTLWWLILRYNGILHPLNISTGTILKIPVLSQIDAILNDRLSNQGQVVEV